MSEPLLRWSPAGLFCEAGGFFIDPHKAVSRAIITHAHADHARSGSKEYLTAAPGERLVRKRIGPRGSLTAIPYGEDILIDGVRVSLHPAGHMLGSAQVRVEHAGEVWVCSGDYKVAADATCAPFEPVRCHTFITEATFAHPQYVWPDQATVWREIEHWHQLNRGWNRASVVYCYAMGKSQRLLAGLRNAGIPLLTHRWVEDATQQYRESGVDLPETRCIDDLPDNTPWSHHLIVAPPNARGGKWARRIGPLGSAFASGWMCGKGGPRPHVDQGFILSDHADWNEILSTVAATGAQHVLVTHGMVGVLIGELRRRGYDAQPLDAKDKQTAVRPLPAHQPPIQRELF